MVSYIKGGMQIKDILKDPEGKIWAQRDTNGQWRSICSEELNSLYRLINVVRVIKSRRLK